MLQSLGLIICLRKPLNAKMVLFFKKNSTVYWTQMGAHHFKLESFFVRVCTYMLWMHAPAAFQVCVASLAMGEKSGFC